MKYIKGSLLIIFVAMCVFFSIDKVEAAQPTKKTSAYNSCVKDGTCNYLCNYKFVFKNDQKKNETKYITMYLHNNDTVSVNFNAKYGNGVNDSKSRKWSKFFNEKNKGITYFIDKSITEENPHCPKNAYIDIASIAPFNELCFDDDGKYCKTQHGQFSTKFGDDSKNFVSTSKTYDLFSEVVSKYTQKVVDETSCDDLANNKINSNSGKELMEKLNQDVFGGNGIPDLVKKYLENKNKTVNSNANSHISNKTNAATKKIECIDECHEKHNSGQLNDEEYENCKKKAESINIDEITEGEKSIYGENATKVFATGEFEFSTYFEDVTCDSLFGDVNEEGSPAYWIHFAMNLIKYIAIIAVLVLSTTDFIKAVAEQNNDALNKAIVTTVKRIVFAVMIFFLPILVDFILNILGLSCIVE